MEQAISVKPLTKTTVNRGGGIAARFAPKDKAAEATTYYVYGLTDPRNNNAVFYVGVSASLPRRIDNHRTDWASAANQICRAIKSAGLKVGCNILGSSLDQIEAKTLERKLITTLPGLVNSKSHKAMLSRLIYPMEGEPPPKPETQRYTKWRAKNPELWLERQAKYQAAYRKRRKAQKEQG